MHNDEALKKLIELVNHASVKSYMVTEGELSLLMRLQSEEALVILINYIKQRGDQ